ncbi:MAG: hypothetical protein GAK40_00896 [Burkholderia plantarii]|nr:MAG: hypothetical protein GAK40_00896 [Burkholderia plantarii]
MKPRFYRISRGWPRAAQARREMPRGSLMPASALALAFVVVVTTPVAVASVTLAAVCVVSACIDPVVAALAFAGHPPAPAPTRRRP